MNKDFIFSEGSNSLKTNIQSLEDVSKKNFVADTSLNYQAIKLQRYYLPVGDQARLNMEECRECGFYPFLEQIAGASTLMTFYSFIFKKLTIKELESEYRFRGAQMLRTMVRMAYL